MKRHFSFFALLAASIVAAGCGGAAGLCDDICDCTGDCSDNDREECYDNVDDAEKYADDRDCSSEFNDYASCLNSEFECRDGGRVDLDGCRFESDELSDCQRRGGGSTKIF